jgi:hypothetical protein
MLIHSSLPEENVSIGTPVSPTYRTVGIHVLLNNCHPQLCQEATFQGLSNRSLDNGPCTVLAVSADLVSPDEQALEVREHLEELDKPLSINVIGADIELIMLVRDN